MAEVVLLIAREDSMSWVSRGTLLCRSQPYSRIMTESTKTLNFFKICPKDITDAPFTREYLAPRSGHRVVADDSNLYCIGGYNPAFWEVENSDETYYPLFREIWKFNFASQKWTKLKTHGSMPREMASHTALMPSKHSILVFGGTGIPFGDQSSNRLHHCNLRTLEWREIECTGVLPQRIYGHSMIIIRDYLYVFGGTTGFVYNNELHRLNLQNFVWEKIESDQKVEPDVRYRQEVGTDGRHLILFGGGIDPHIAYGFEKMHMFDTEELKWKLQPTYPDSTHGHPPARRCHSCVQLQTDVYMCGGYDSQTVFGDVWRLDTLKLQWTKLSTEMPKPAYFHSAAVTPCGLMCVQGGVVHINHNERTSEVYCVWLKMPSLAEQCWQTIIKTIPNIDTMDRSELLELGIPQKYVDRIDGTPTAA